MGNFLVSRVLNAKLQSFIVIIYCCLSNMFTACCYTVFHAFAIICHLMILSVYLSVCLSVYLSVYLSIHLSRQVAYTMNIYAYWWYRLPEIACANWVCYWELDHLYILLDFLFHTSIHIIPEAEEQGIIQINPFTAWVQHFPHAEQDHLVLVRVKFCRGRGLTAK